MKRKVRISRQTAVAVVLALTTVLYGASASAFIDFGSPLILAEMLANGMKQLSVATSALAEVKRTYDETRKLAAFAEDAAMAAQSFRSFSATRFGASFVADVEAASPDLQRYRRDAIAGLGLVESGWVAGTGAGPAGTCLGGVGCGKAIGAAETKRLVSAVQETFGKSGLGAADETKAVDAEVAAAIAGDVAQSRTAALEKARLRDLLQVCTGGAGLSAREAKIGAEECKLAAEHAQVLQLGEGQESNVKLAELARLQAIAVEQKNSDLKRAMAEEDARRRALTAGLDDLVRQRIRVRTGGLEF
jgi:hypothetical protein